MARQSRRAVLEVWVGDKHSPARINCLESPSDEEIEEQLKVSPGGDQVSSIEVHISKTHHIAVGGSTHEGFYARYREFSRAGEWQTPREDLSLQATVELLKSYRDQTPTWKQLVEWQRRPVGEPLKHQRCEHELREGALWLTKGTAFVAGLFGIGSGSGRRTKPKTRKFDQR